MNTTQKKSEEATNLLTGIIIGAAMEVHRELGPGLLELVYEECLIHELRSQQLTVESQKSFPIKYKNITIDHGYRLDILVNNQVIVEVKSVSILNGLHEAQLLSYLKLHGGDVTGLLMNFNVNFLREGIRRINL